MSKGWEYKCIIFDYKIDKGLYLAVSTEFENEVANQVYSSLLSKLMIIDGLTHLYEIDWAKDTSRPDEYVNPMTIDALCIGNVFLEKYHSIGSKKYELVGGYEDMYKLSMSYQPLYTKILKENQQLAKKSRNGIHGFFRLLSAYGGIIYLSYTALSFHDYQ